MGTLNTSRNIAGADDFYAELLAAHDGLTKPASDALNARLILILANHIGDRDIVRQAIAAARATTRE